LPPNKVVIEERDGFRYITCNGIANHETGKFPGPGNPGRISAQDWKFRMPLQPVVAQRATATHHDKIGVAINGVPFDAPTNEFWNNNRAWNYEALSGKIYLGTDSSNAHVQPGGIYHYHGMPNGLIQVLAKQKPKNQMMLIGYAADGFPIYTNYGHANANDPKSPLKKLRSSYRLKAGTRPDGDDGPGGTYDGTFGADWEYVEGAGDLDECNGRIGVTPEYPGGTFYYAVTDEFPFLSRYYRATPDASFGKPKGGPGGPGGPRGQGGGQGGQGQGGPGGRGGRGGQEGPGGRGGPGDEEGPGGRGGQRGPGGQGGPGGRPPRGGRDDGGRPDDGERPDGPPHGRPPEGGPDGRGPGGGQGGPGGRPPRGQRPADPFGPLHPED
jgi:hypothetical protein